MSSVSKRDLILPILLAVCALAVSGTAAFYSVTGLSKLFAGASTQVLIMAGALEVSKLVIASFLYRYWEEISNILKYYLTTATVILVLITSLGIYGFLTSAYQVTSDRLALVESRVESAEVRKERFNTQIAFLNTQQETVDQRILQLTSGLSTGTTVQYENESGQIITTTSSAARRSLENQLSIAMKDREGLSKEIQALSDSVTVVEASIIGIKQETEIAGEVGPLRYLSGITGMEMERIVNIFTLVIIFVFDPLAISLVIAANIAFRKLEEQPSFPTEPIAYEEETSKDVLISQEKENIEEPIPLESKESITKVLQYTPSKVSVLTDKGVRKKISKEEYKKSRDDLSKTY